MKLIRNAKLIDGTGAAPIDGAAVLIDDGRIQAVGPTASVDAPPDAEVIDAGGMALLPGLIDCHDHLASFSYEIASRWGITEARSLRHLRIAAVLKQTLETGYTTVRDAGGLDAGFRMAVDEGLIPGPRLQVGLGFITPTGGMGDRLSALGYPPPAGPDSGLPWGVADGADAMRAKVREMVRAGADLVKTATTGGASSTAGLGPKDMLFERDELDALVDEAHKRGLRVMCHALGGPGLRAGVETGVNSIEHGTYLDEDPDLLKMMVDKDVYFIPTFSVYVHHATKGTPHGRARAAALKEHHVRSLEMAMAAGVKVVAGTDEGGWEHGNNAHEVICLTEAGMTPMQAIVAATGHAAQCIGLEKEIGTVEAGKKADLVLVDGDPSQDIKVLERGKGVRLVIKDGKVYKDDLALM